MTDAQACYDSDQLRDFLLGKLSEQESTLVSEHLELCPSCKGITESLPANDLLVDTMRQSARQPQAEPTAHDARVIAQLRDRSAAKHAWSLRTRIENHAISIEQPTAISDVNDDVTRELSNVWLPSQNPDEIGRLGSYRILRLLGAGGMGAVFLAEETNLCRKVALKMMRPRVAVNPGAAKRFLREARAAASLHHDHIITVYQVGEEAGVPFLAMEYLEGESLDDRLKRQSPLPLADILQIGREIAEALAAAHAKGLLHRDIKPANVWLEEKSKPGEEQDTLNHRVKILDFGLARSIEDDLNLTSSGMIVGTPSYMAPEQASGDAVDGRADLFALGVILYRMTTGLLPFPGRTSIEVLKSLATLTPAAPLSHNPDVPQELSDLIEQLMSKEANARPESAVQVALRLGQIERIRSRSSILAGADPFTKTGLEAATRNTTIELDPTVAQGKFKSNQRQQISYAAIGAAFLGFIALAGVGISLIPKGDKLPVAAEPQDSQTQSTETTRAEREQVIPRTRKRLGYEKPGFDEWEESVSALSADKQLEAVSRKLEELNPGFDGKLEGFGKGTVPEIVDGAVRSLGICTDHVTDISPVRAFTGLLCLRGAGSDQTKGTLADLSPLQGLSLSKVSFSCNKIADLTPLKDMPLRFADFTYCRIADLSPLRGKSLFYLSLYGTFVTDISPLAEIPVETLNLHCMHIADLKPLKSLPLRQLQLFYKMDLDTRLLRSIKTLEIINEMPADEFCKMVEEHQARAKRPLAFTMPGFDAWVKHVNTLPATQQVEEVVKKLRELNPGFDGQNQATVEKNVVTKLELVADQLTDISPVRAFQRLDVLKCTGSNYVAVPGGLSDISPLASMRLSYLYLNSTNISDLSPLRGMKLTDLGCESTNVADLAPLRGMHLNRLSIAASSVSDLTPLKGMRLTIIQLNSCPIADLSPLRGMPLNWVTCINLKGGDFSPLADSPIKEIWFDFDRERDTDLLRSIKTLETVNDMPAAQFWNSLDLKPIKSKPMAFETPGFDEWEKSVRAQSAEKQLEAVSKKLMELNPGFDGKLVGRQTGKAPTIVEGTVRSLAFCTDHITDLSPVRGLPKLEWLECTGSADYSSLHFKGRLSDLSPLTGLPLRSLFCSWNSVSDLTPLKEVRLENLNISGCPVSDLSPLQGQPLKGLFLHSNHITDLSPLMKLPLQQLFLDSMHVADLTPLKDLPLKSLRLKYKLNLDTQLLRSIKGLETINEMPAGEFCTMVESHQARAKLPLAFTRPEFDVWAKQVAALPAEQQVQEVVKNLQKLNPGFDGKNQATIEQGVVTGIELIVDHLTDISPVRAFPTLSKLNCHCSGYVEVPGALSDISPLSGMKLSVLWFAGANISDLSPLRGMPLNSLACSVTNVSDLAPLRGMPLWSLNCSQSPVSDLSPLQGMQIGVIQLINDPIADLSPLRGMPLIEVNCTNIKCTDLTPLKDCPIKDLSLAFDRERDADLLRSIKTLETINDVPVAEFWKEADSRQ